MSWGKVESGEMMTGKGRKKEVKREITAPAIAQESSRRQKSRALWLEEGVCSE